MPMMFPNMASLKAAAEVHHFRLRKHAESEDTYRKELSLWVCLKDKIEAVEIFCTKGWEEWDHEAFGRALMSYNREIMK